MSSLRRSENRCITSSMLTDLCPDKRRSTTKGVEELTFNCKDVRSMRCTSKAPSTVKDPSRLIPYLSSSCLMKFGRPELLGSVGHDLHASEGR